MKMKKVVSLILAAAMVFGLTACGNKESGNSGSTGGNTSAGAEENAGTENNGADDSANAGSSEGLIEISMPTYLAGENVGAVFFLPHIERFNQKYEGKYKINIEEVPQASYAEKIKQLAQQKKLPVLVHAAGSGGIDVQWFKDVVVANDMAYDLSEFLETHPEVKANLVPESIDYCTVDGKVVNMPMAVLKPVGLYYNSSMYTADKDIKDMSMDEFISNLGENKIAFQTADNGWTTGLLLSAIVASQEGGVDLIKNAADEKLYDYTDPAIVKSVEILQKLLQTNASSNSIGAAYADAANAFMSKNASIICNGSWMASEFAEDAKDKWSNEFNGEDVKATIYPGDVALVNPRVYGEFWVSNNATDAEKELALAYLEFRASQEEIEALILAEGGTAPTLEYSEEFLAKQEETPILAQLAASVTDSTTYAVALFDVMPSSVADTEFGKLLPKLADNTLTAEQFCQELTKKAEEAR